ncbi:MAG: MerR family transcriptional regulator [Eubacteriales bacterium]|nr:MerR family transcriptional regulator [Eubacteriales bacterium]
MKDLFTIGEIASLFSVNIRTLRYYDAYGILKPERTDPDTGYRYYSTRQFERLNTIKYLRALDMPLEKIARFFENRDTQVLRGLLQEQRKETQGKLEKLHQIERKLEKRLSQLDDAEYGEPDTISLVHCPARSLAFLKKEIRPDEDLEYPIRELDQKSGLESMIFLGKVGLSISRARLMERQFDAYDGIFVLVEQEDRFQGEERTLPEGEYVQIRFSGTHQNAGAYYQKLFTYMEENGLSCAGDSVEVTLIDAGFTDDESKYVTQLQIPVAF